MLMTHRSVGSFKTISKVTTTVLNTISLGIIGGCQVTTIDVELILCDVIFAGALGATLCTYCGVLYTDFISNNYKAEF